jgi:glycosyltransferase involved in cell wall biosynthesis
VNNLDPEALSAAMADLLANPEAARRLGAAGRETICTRFSAGEMVDATLRLYEKVTGDQ